MLLFRSDPTTAPTVVRVFCSLLAALMLSLTVAACHDHGNDAPEPFRALTGVWDQAGYGRAWAFTRDRLVRYEYNQFGCLQAGEEPLSTLAKSAAHFDVADDGRSFLLRDLAAKPWRFQRIQTLPDACQHPLSGEQTPLTQFDYFWHTFNDYYAFFEERGLDWQAVYSAYRPRIAAAATDTERKAIYVELLGQFDDAHVALGDRQQFEIYGENSAEHPGGLVAETLSSPLITDRDETGHAQLANLSRAHIDSLLQQGTRQQAGESIDGITPMVWGRLQDDVGYLRIERLYDLNEISDIDNVQSALEYIERETRFIDEQFLTIKRDLAGVRAMVIDLRYNGGGFDHFGLRMASHFNVQPREIATSTVTGQVAEAIMLPARADAWDIPLVVFTSADTASAAEVMSLAFSALPQTQLLGEATHGVFSDVLDRALPNGWFAGLSNERYEDTQGHLLEARGVEPDVVVSSFASMDILLDSNTLVDRALQQLGQAPVNAVTDDELASTIADVQSQLGIPGLALAVIKQGQLVWAQGYGWADRENEIPVTVHTPFSLASISKTMVGTYLMQQEALGVLSLDDSVDALSPGFVLGTPHADARAITLRDLATHGSGIVDDAQGYRCNYYTRDDGESLLNLLLDDPSLCPLPYTDQQAYLQNYLSADGDLYSPTHFSTAPGQQWQYSNVAAALAGQLIENHSGVPLPSGMQTHLFGPLGMHDTGWDNASLVHIPARLYTHWLGGDSAQLLPDYRYSDRYSGGVWSSVSDISRYLLAITRGGEMDGIRVLSESQVTKMLSDQAEVETGGVQQGIFWVRNGNFIGHDGSDPGVETLMYYNPVTEVGIVLLANTDSLLRANDDGSLSPTQPYYVLLRAMYRNGLGR